MNAINLKWMLDDSGTRFRLIAALVKLGMTMCRSMGNPRVWETRDKENVRKERQRGGKTGVLTKSV